MVGSWAVLKIKDSKFITKQLLYICNAYILSKCVHFKTPGKQKLDDKSESDYTWLWNLIKDTIWVKNHTIWIDK